MVTIWATPTMAKVNVLILSDSVFTSARRSVVKAFIAPPFLDGGKKMFLCVYLLSAGIPPVKTMELVYNTMNTTNTTAIACRDFRANIVKPMLTNANQSLASMDPLASMELTTIPASVSLDTKEKTAKSTSMNAILSHARTVVRARISSTLTPANAFLASKEMIAKSTLMNVRFQSNWTCLNWSLLHQNPLPDHLPTPSPDEVDAKAEFCNPELRLVLARTELFAMIS
jgi:hypothetical protein